ncbi:MAG: hypothetical protein RIQ41_44 [Candidatus Parcubacteria bacterium]|jgi:poly-gamma-glutamate synthesis protein (capsule biosynthesis protein)
MKKIFLFLVVCGVIVYGICWRLSEMGWTIFDTDTPTAAVQTQTSELSVATSTPLLFVGDIMLGRYVEKFAHEEGNDLRSFEMMRDFLKAHITIANLEGPIPDTHTPTPANGFSFSFSSSTPHVLREGGVTAVSLANNHMFDHGTSGYEATKQALARGDVKHFGGYAPTTDDYFETKLGTTTVIVYGITMIATGWDEEQALAITKTLRAEHPSAYLVAFLHWGDEYVTQNTYQRAFAHRLVDEGVDTIIGSHPHVVQGIEMYKNVPIFYSLGNFIFDQYWRSDLEDGVLVQIEQEQGSSAYTLIPIRSSRSVPYIAEGQDRTRILARIAEQSDENLKADILEGTISISLHD